MIIIWAENGKWYFSEDRSSFGRWRYDSLEDCQKAYRVWRDAMIAELNKPPVIELE
jgi:hypothetical protein